MYKKGEYVKQDYAAAFDWFKLSAEQGYGIAQYYMGEAYRHGEGVKRHYQTAAEWYEKAAEQHHVSSKIGSKVAGPLPIE